MSSFLVTSPYESWEDEDGKPLEDGYIYIGTSGLNPETNPIQAYWDADSTLPASQPIRTLGGYPSRQGSPSRIYVTTDDYSQTVRDKKGALVYSELSQKGVIVSATTVDAIADLKLITGIESQKIDVLSYYAPNYAFANPYDEGGGQFAWDATSTEADNGGTIIEATSVATGRWIRLNANSPVNVKQFGAKGDDATDDYLPIQAATDYARVAGYDIYSPEGTYRLSQGIKLIINATERTSNFYGDGKTSTWDWRGANDGGMLQIYGGVINRAVQSICSVKTMHFTNSIAATGVIGLQIGQPLSDGFGVGNMTIAENTFFGLDIGIDVRFESDEMTIERNHFDTYTTYGVYIDRSRVMRVNNNHFQTGADNSIGLLAETDGRALTFNGNVVQGANAIQGVKLDGYRGFTILGNYFETADSATGGAVLLNDCNSGLVAGNHIGGYPNADLYAVSGTSNGIEFGSNNHTRSGGEVTALIATTGTPSGIVVSAEQQTTGGIFALSGTGYVMQAGATDMVIPVLNSISGTITIAGSTTDTIFTAENEGAYQLYVSQNTEEYNVYAIIKGLSGTATAFLLGESDPGDLNITFSGLDVIIDNTITAPRTFKWYAIRMATD